MLIRRKLVKAKAKELLSAWGKKDLPISIKGIAKSHGILVDEDKEPKESLSGFLLVDGDTKIIGVNKSHSIQRRRFTIAHELGHFFLHTNVDGDPHVDNRRNISSTHFRDVLSSEGINAEEIEANLFAAELLMPEEIIIEKISHYSETPEYCGEEIIEKLAEDFDVSIQAMTVRLTNLGLLKI